MGRAKPGPKPKPAEIRELEGNPGKRAIKRGPTAAAASLTPPDHLTPTAAKFWKKYSPTLSQLGLLTVVDVEAFAALCEAWAFMVVAKKSMRIRGTGDAEVVTTDRAHGAEKRKHPAFTIYKQAEASYLNLAREFGMTPSSRVGLPSPDDDDEDDDLYDS